MSFPTDRLIPAIAGIVITTLAAPMASASVDKDREDAGMQALGIGENFGRWPDGVVVWQYNPTGAPAYHSDDNAFVALLQQAMDEIEGVAGVDFQYQGIDGTATVLDFSDGVVTVGWENLNGAAGVAGPASQCTGQQFTALGYCQYFDGSVRFNLDPGDINWDKGDAEASGAALIQVAMHEILHLLGIGHSDQPISIMYADPYTNLSRLRVDDIDVLRAMYGEAATSVDPATYSPPPDNVAPVVQNTYLADNDNIQSPISTIGDGETSTFVGLTWEALPGPHPTVEFVVTGPEGYFFAKRLDERDCTAQPGFFCIFWFSGVSTSVLETFPGTWTFYVIVDGDLETTHVLDNQFTAPVINQAPDADISFDVTAGPSPLTVNATLTISGDNEGDNVSATWHIPTVGEIDVDFGGSFGQDFRQFTFNSDGDYEVYVQVTDDGSRYGAPGSGNEAGPGFRKLFRQVISVGPVAMPDPFQGLVVLPDVNGNGSSDIAVSIPETHRVHVRDGADDSLLGDVNLGDYPLLALKMVPDLDSDGNAQIAALQERAGGDIWAVVKDPVSGTTLTTLTYGSQYSGLDMTLVTDFSGNGLPELAVLGQEPGTDRIRVQIRDAASNAGLKSIFLGNRMIAHHVVAVADVTGNTIADIATMGVVKTSNQIMAPIRDASTTALHQTVFWANQFEPVATFTIADINGGGAPELVALGRDPVSGAGRLQIRDVTTRTPITTIFLGSSSEVLELAILNDTNANGYPDVAVLSRQGSGAALVRVYDSSTGILLKNVFYNSLDDPDGLASLPDISGNGIDEIAVLGTSGGRQVQIKDASTGLLVNSIDYP